MTSMIRFIGKLSFVVVLLLLLFSYAMFQGGFVSWFLFFAVLPIFLYHLGLLFYPIKNWRVTRQLSSHVTRAGDRIQVTLRLQRSFPFPLYYCICEELLPDTLQKMDDYNERYRYLDQPDKRPIPRRIKQITFPGFRRVVDLPYVIEQIPRGEHALQAVRVRTGDVFGIITKEHIFHVNDQISAFPNERPVKLGETINSYEQGSVSSQSMNLKNTNVATGIREYTPGDKFSWIDWKQTARKNTIITKEFEQEKSTDTVIVLDACYYKGINELAFETGIELTMSLLGSIQTQTSQAAFLSIGTNTVYFPLQRDPIKRNRIRQHLTNVQPGGTAPFSVKLRENLMQIASGANLILVTTHLENDFQDVVRKVSQHTRKLVVIFVQAAAFISIEEQNMIRHLRSEGIVINVVTENDLARKIIEVTIV
ncbi:DUF58 domain-containing protein [Lentibacillus salinarum]|uniref:DUF58 domain-containing protein n=1 Tax=Lentibacillus salinarum TaxID=446820 RepID=A0ABW3ZR91_9BACI